MNALVVISVALLAALASAQSTPPSLPAQFSANMVLFTANDGQPQLFAGAYYVDTATRTRRLDYTSIVNGLTMSVYTSFDSEGKPEPYDTILFNAPPSNVQMCVMSPSSANDTLWNTNELADFTFGGQQDFYGTQAYLYVLNDMSNNQEVTVYVDAGSLLPIGVTNFNYTTDQVDLSINLIGSQASVPPGVFDVPTLASGCPKNGEVISARSMASVEILRQVGRRMRFA